MPQGANAKLVNGAKLSNFVMEEIRFGHMKGKRRCSMEKPDTFREEGYIGPRPRVVMDTTT